MKHRETGYRWLADFAGPAVAGSRILLNRLRPVQCHIDEAIGIGFFEIDLAI